MQAPWTPTITLEDIFERFNINRPNDFHGHSLSVSDVVVTKQDRRNKSVLCGFLWLSGTSGLCTAENGDTGK